MQSEELDSISSDMMKIGFHSTAVPQQTSLASLNIENNKDREIALQANNEFDAGNYSLVIELLDTLGTNKAVTHNRLVSQFGIDNDVDSLLSGLITSEDLDLDQHVLIDYNRALVLAKYKQRYDEAIDLLETRMNVLAEPFGLIDERLAVKLCLLLVILYIEKRKDPMKALPLLQFISEKCDSSSMPSGLQQLKAKCYLQMGSTKSAKRELKSIGGEPLLRSYLEFQRSNYKKAMKIMSTCSDGSPLCINNEALIQYGLGKRNTATFMMLKTLKSATPEMLYNFGVFHLFTGNSKSAFDIFYNLVPFYRRNPRIWLRLAECCLEKRNKSLNKSDYDMVKRKHDVVAGHIGEGIHRKLALNGCIRTACKDSETVCFARACLNNALSLLNSPSERNFLPSNAPLDTEINRLKISTLIALAYVNLTLLDYSLALRHAHDAIKLSPSGYQKVLAHLYVGEALVWLDQISEAIGHFNPEMMSNELSGAELNTSSPSWYPGSAKAILLYNLAVAYSLRGDMEKASETLRQVGASNDPSLSGQIFMLAIYLQLQQGNIDVAKTLIKQQLPQYR